MTFKCTFATLKAVLTHISQLKFLKMNTSILAARLSQQISATYARNNFKEVNEKAIKEGMCVIIRKSKPVTVVLSITEYEKLQKAYEKYETYKNKIEKPAKKITLEELRKDSFFDKYAGCMKDDYPGMTALEWQHNWYKYVD